MEKVKAHRQLAVPDANSVKLAKPAIHALRVTKANTVVRTTHQHSAKNAVLVFINPRSHRQPVYPVSPGLTKTKPIKIAVPRAQSDIFPMQRNNRVASNVKLENRHQKQKVCGVKNVCQVQQESPVLLARQGNTVVVTMIPTCV